MLISQVDDARRVFWPPSTPPSPAVAPDDKPVPSVPVTPAPDIPKETKPEPKPAAAPPSTVRKDRVFAHCQYGVMPSVVPPEGHIYVLVPQGSLPAQMGGGGRRLFW